MKYISSFAKYFFLWIFFYKSDFFNVQFFVTFVQQIFRRDPPIFFSFFLRSYQQKRKKRKVKKIQAIFVEKYFFKEKKQEGGQICPPPERIRVNAYTLIGIPVYKTKCGSVLFFVFKKLIN